MARRAYDGRQLYDLEIYRGRNRKEAVTTHLDLDSDEAKMRALILAAMKNDRADLDDIGEWSMTIRDHGESRLLMTYVTTADS
ncbi:hypothetical protein [Actinoplanes utahensis]|uniref:Uncharacterized protein n=1 Tax=Actinoplanes utahensis TaxID=1869 RepID=A0A0A6XGP9_ACTUT|nr:hypothetical protein [Actinoplanes utahensis]KHD79272.1 hypothetical protein MB27_01315 [Actinoplanes utahensis]GIF30291.1 hypothetical protein Aut01nite_32770 [Actinoplanes utahensis]